MRKPETRLSHQKIIKGYEVGKGQVVFTSREHVIALEPRGKGLLGITLRYPYEVRKEEEYFADIPDEKIPKDMLELAAHIVETKAGHFAPEEFEDRYEDALKELLKKKQAGVHIETPKERAPAKVINLMDALRRSVEAERGGQQNDKLPHPPNVQRRKNRVSVSHLMSRMMWSVCETSQPAAALITRPAHRRMAAHQFWRRVRSGGSSKGSSFSWSSRTRS
jgi:hypothetical protein